MADDLNFPAESADIWELALFLSKESILLRSFLNYLRTPEGDANLKMEQFNRWEKYVGFQFGHPELDEDAKDLFQRFLDASEPERRKAIQTATGLLQSKYFQG